MTTKWLKYCKFLLVCCVIAVSGGCEEDDDYRGYMLSGRWFGELGMMVDGQPAIGSDLEFVPDDYGGYSEGYGYERDYYYDPWNRVNLIEHYFDWSVWDGIIYLYFDDPGLDCSIRDYRLSSDYFEGYMDGTYSSTRFKLRNYERYWEDYGYWGSYYSYRSGGRHADTPIQGETPECTRTVNVNPLDRPE